MNLESIFAKIKYDAITATMALDELKDLDTKLGSQRAKGGDNMKLSEVFSELENGSPRTYEAYYDAGTRVTISRDGERLNFQKFNHEGTPHEKQSTNGCFSGNCRLGLDWYPVKRLVEWDEAIREWLLGKKAYCEIGGRRIEPDFKEINIKFTHL